MFEKLIGLSFISLASDMLLSGSSFKKYIKAVIGAVFVLTVISGVLKADNFKIDIPSEDTFYENSADFHEMYYESLREEVVLNTEKAIKEEFFKENIEISSMTIDFNEDFSIEKIKIYLKNYSKDYHKAIELLVNYFKIGKEVISLCQG